MQDTEIWKPAVDFQDYEVSDCGRVRSILRTKMTKNGMATWKSHIIKGIFNNSGYLRVLIRKDDKGHSKAIHCMVAEAFIGPRPEGFHVCHCDGDRTNNVLSNLRYDTAKGNASDKFAHGTQLLGEDHYHSKLTNQDVLAIRAMFDPPKYEDVAAKFGVSPGTIAKIIRRQSWTHI